MATPQEFITLSSMNNWYPKTKHLDIPMPKTEIIFERNDPVCWWGLLDDEKLSGADLKLLHDTANRIGFPLFMRNDLTSGKHNYEDTCFVSDESVLDPHLYRVVEDSALKDQLMTSIALREYIEPDWQFKAFRGLPISPERRYFISNGKVSCFHPYWVEEAIEFRYDSEPVENWEDSLEKMNTQTPEEIALLTGYAEKIAAVLEGDWSLDFAKARNGLWYFIDAAEAKKSWHPSGCKNCPEGRGEKKKKKKQPFPLWYSNKLFTE